MKIKLNRVKLQGFFELIEHLLYTGSPQNEGEQILFLLVESIRIKFRNRLDEISMKDNYQVTLKEHEALALKVWLGQQQVPAHYFDYEQNVAQQVCIDIDKRYGRHYKENTNLRGLAAGSSKCLPDSQHRN